jgi:hypothetical protein
MSKRSLLFAACILLFAGPALAGGTPDSDPPALLSLEGPSCQADAATAALAEIGIQPIFKGHDPALCWKCQHCSSTNVCAGKLIGDPCSSTGGTCQAVDGCALYNCCRCANIQPLVAAAATGGIGK